MHKRHSFVVGVHGKRSRQKAKHWKLAVNASTCTERTATWARVSALNIRHASEAYTNPDVHQSSVLSKSVNELYRAAQEQEITITNTQTRVFAACRARTWRMAQILMNPY